MYTNDGLGKKRSCLTIAEIDCHIHFHCIKIRNLNELINLMMSWTSLGEKE